MVLKIDQGLSVFRLGWISESLSGCGAQGNLGPQHKQDSLLRFHSVEGFLFMRCEIIKA